MKILDLYKLLNHVNLHDVCRIVYSSEFVDEYLIDKELKSDYSNGIITLYYSDEVYETIVLKVSNIAVMKMIKNDDKHNLNFEPLCKIEEFIRRVNIMDILC